jgi:hypothetical protein
MKKHIWNLGASLVLASTLLVSCSDSVVDPSASDAVVAFDDYDATLVDETLLVKTAEVPTVDQALLENSYGDDSCSGDREHAGHRGGRHDGRKHGRHGGKGDIAPLGIRNYRQAASQLGLSAEQDSLLKGFLKDLRECAEAPAEAFRTARAAAFEPYRASVEEIRASVKAGTMTREDAKTALDSIRAEFETVIAPLKEELRAAVESCRTTFEAAFEATLTAEQMEKWLSIKEK